MRIIALPPHINAVTLPNDDGTFDIYINANLPLCKQRQALAHELCHIKHDHFYNDKAEIREIETEANTAGSLSKLGA